MVITDLDGTLAQTGGIVSSTDLATLEKLGKEGVLRVVATGRNLFSCRRVLKDDFPIDYLIFSSGVGVQEWKTKKILQEHFLAPRDVSAIVHVLMEERFDFMVHARVPDNHKFIYHKSNLGNTTVNADFDTRVSFYNGHCEPHNGESWEREASQFLCVTPPDSQDRLSAVFARLKDRLKEFSVIRATSPFDGKSLWAEIFHRNVAKELAAIQIANLEGVSRARILAVGNDYNDLGLLSWAGTSFLVANASVEIDVPRVASHNENGFSEAVAKWSLRVD
jgi:HAD superfamily hydrolase (TIGR01484 family)